MSDHCCFASSRPRAEKSSTARRILRPLVSTPSDRHAGRRRRARRNPGAPRRRLLHGQRRGLRAHKMCVRLIIIPRGHLYSRAQLGLRAAVTRELSGLGGGRSPARLGRSGRAAPAGRPTTKSSCAFTCRTRANRHGASTRENVNACLRERASSGRTAGSWRSRIGNVLATRSGYLPAHSPPSAFINVTAARRLLRRISVKLLVGLSRSQTRHATRHVQ